MDKINEKYVDGKQIVWDASSLGTFQLCPRKYKYTNLEGRIPHLAGKSLAATWGIAFHDCAEVLARGEGIDNTILKAFGWREILLDLGRVQRKPDNARTFKTLCRALIWYNEEYASSQVKTVKIDGEFIVENRFEVPILDRWVSGRLDRLVEFMGGLYIFDTKTTTKGLNNWYFQDFKPNTQVMTYIYVFKYILGLPILGFIVDGVQVLVGSNKFARSIITVEEEELFEFIYNLEWIFDEADRMHLKNYYPMRDSGCFSFGGCEYRKVCSNPASIREKILNENFNIRSK